MPEAITPEIFDHLVSLAALELSPSEAEYLRSQLNAQLTAIRELAAIPLDDGAAITSHGIPYPPQIRPPLRKDIRQDCENPEEILEQAPQVEDGYIIVPEIPHTELE
jgi:aspartyl-tRNA(Asn)/glutamyl-tRNA(Gln) amidotransferase subunit C